MRIKFSNLKMMNFTYGTYGPGLSLRPGGEYFPAYNALGGRG